MAWHEQPTLPLPPTTDPLAGAAARGDVSMIDALLSTVLPERQRIIDDALMVACRHGQMSAAEVLISHGGNVRVDFGSCLMWACHAQHIALIEMLIDKGADVNTLRGCPMRIAMRQGVPDVVRALVGRGGRIE
jgi:hypothetical protein